MESSIAIFLGTNENSKLREQTAEYKLLSELLIYSASIGKKLEISRVEHDSFGYDIILKVDKIIKYIQLKSKKKKGKTPSWDIHKSLINNKNGTVLLILIDYTENDIALDYYLMKEESREKIIEQPPKKEKDYKCKINKGDFIEMTGIPDLFSRLFSCAKK